MISVKQGWERLLHGRPGHRFQEYHRAHEGSRGSAWGRVASLAIATALILGGIVALPTPVVPGFIPIAIGGALIARESWWVARGMDWLELRIRAGFRAIAALWKRASPVVKFMAGLAGVGLVFAALLLVRAIAFHA